MLGKAVRARRKRAVPMLESPRLTLIVRWGRDVIPETGENGAAGYPGNIGWTIDPDRDGPAEMASYLRYLPAAYTGLSGTPEAIARSATAWGVKYAKIDEGSADGYGMAHTADVFLVDAAGSLRARFPFGTEPGPIAAELRPQLCP